MNLPRKPHHKQLQRGPGPVRHKRINARSARREEEAAGRSAIRQQVFQRDGRRCLLRGSVLGPCTGRLTPHHLWKEGQGGPYVAWNLITLCAHHNDGIETYTPRSDLVAWGLVAERGDRMDAVWRRLALADIASCWHDGSPLRFDPPPFDHVRTS